MKSVKLIGLGLVLSLFAAGCTKERPYKEVLKEDLGIKQEFKSIIDTQADYLYAPSTVESSRTSSASRPHWMGDAKRIRFQFTETDLEVIEMDGDPRFAGNPANNKSVLSIPIEHIDYKCREDAYGDCTHEEEEDNDISWKQKSQFRLKPNDMAIQQLNFLPVEIGKFFGGCYTEVGGKFVKAELLSDSINLILEKTFQSAAHCTDFSELQDLSDITFTVRYQHSFIRLDKAISKNYKPARYTRADEGNFGYFTTRRHQLDVDNNDTVQSENFLFDRWNPYRKVTYYLSESFNQKENQSLKKATYEAFGAINNALKAAGTQLRLELKEPVAGMSSGDLRYNMVVAEEDPQAAGVIGYGPHAANPLTGEIVQARTVMYLGTIKKYLKYSYDEIVQAKLEQQEGEKAQENNALKAGSKSGADKTLLSLAPHLRVPSHGEKSNQALGHSSEAANVLTGTVSSRIKSEDIVVGGVSEDKLKQFAVDPHQHQIFARNLKEKVQFMSANCQYPAELFNFTASIDKEVDAVIDEVGAKPWDQLSLGEKQVVIDKLLPHVWIPTLIHEVGHNLGLRHNFAGSEDVDNFYSQDELQQLGVTKPFKYSSVMDYAYRTTNELRMMGKYDIAALRYGYAEKVELADGRIVTLTELRENPALELKAYGYCTDEHVGANPNCNRFDEGTNILEITQHYIKAYEERYSRANFRNGRRRFSLSKDSSQMAAIDNTMSGLRLVFERYENIKNTFGLNDEAQEWQSIEFLKQLKDATLLAGQFYLNVLKTPDTLCLISQAANPAQIVAVVPIRQFSKSAISCFDSENVRLNEQYMIVGQGGKSFQSRKDPHSNNPYMDEIDVRGIWMDKLLAAHYLLSRELGSSLFDKYTENFLHVPELVQPIMQTIEQLLTDEIAGPVTFDTVFGFSADLNISYKLHDSTDSNNSHKIPALLDPVAQRVFELPDRTVLFHPKLIGILHQALPSRIHHVSAEQVLGHLTVNRSVPNDGRESEYIGVQIANKRYFTHPDNLLAAETMANYNIVNLLSQLSLEQIQKLIEMSEQNSTPPRVVAAADTELSELEKTALRLGKDTLEKFVNEGFQNSSFYALMIQSMADHSVQ